MRNLVYAINLTADGCCDHTKVIGSEEILEYYTDLLGDAGLLLYGRITYQLMVPYWPDVAKNPANAKAAIEFAQRFNSIDKVVFSTSIDNAEGKKARIVRSGLVEEILRLKKEEGKNIYVGGVALPSQLMALGLIDEYYIVVQPLIVGDGRRLFAGVSLQEKLQLRLVDAKTFKSGIVALHYLKQ